CEAVQVVRAAGLGAGAGHAFAAEGLNADNSADHVAIDVAVADLEASDDALDGDVDAAVDAEGQAVTQAIDLVDHLIEFRTLEPQYVDQRAELFVAQLVDRFEAEDTRCHVGTG